MSDDDKRKRQQFLFGPPADATQNASPDPVVAPADVEPELKELAAQLPKLLRLGTSSWSFQGWNGIVYAPGTKQSHLARHGLAAYGKHPLLRTVGLDRTFYAPIAEAEFAAYRASVPTDFRFLVKAFSDLVTPRLRNPSGRPGKPNPRWLDVNTALDLVLTPAVLGLGEALGPLLFQFPPQGVAIVREPQRFAERLHTFLAALPKGPCYAVELRDAGLLTADYVQALAAAGATHCYSVHPSMPTVAEQRAQCPFAREVVVRWMLQPGSTYEDAKEHYEPFDRLVDPDPASRSEVADLIAEALARSLPVTTVVNNKAEGSSPLSIGLLAKAIRDRLPAPPTRA